tara:strand:- start:51502 stop:52014 length:513 start_codon:yes stop_codon:yes gene_type:complete
MILIFIVVLFALEIAAFVEVGGEIGVLSTLLVILLSAMYGIGQLKYYTMYISQSQGGGKKEVADRMFHGVCGILASLLLVVPGFVTDGLGLLLLIPFVRIFLRTFILDSIVGGYTFGLVDTGDLNDMKDYYKKKKSSRASAKSKVEKIHVVEAEFEIVEADDKKNDTDSK